MRSSLSLIAAGLIGLIATIEPDDTTAVCYAGCALGMILLAGLHAIID